MKTNLVREPQLAWLTNSLGCLCALTLACTATASVEEPRRAVSVDTTSAAYASATADAQAMGNGASKSHRIVIGSVDVDNAPAKKQRAEVTWLGVATEETPESVSAQLGLKRGEGLLVTYVAPNSPAAKAGVQRNDVLTGFADQVLVHPMQLRKLVQMHQEGDAIDLNLYRSGKKQSVSVKLGKNMSHVGSLDDLSSPDGLRGLKLELDGINDAVLSTKMKTLHEALASAGMHIDKTLDLEARRNLEKVHEALQQSLRQATNWHVYLGPAAKELEALARSSVDVNKDASVTVKSQSESVKTIVKTDDSGTYVIIANPRKRLMVHDPQGKLLFDGEIESTEQQDKVPRNLWEKVQPMLEQLGHVKADDPDADLLPNESTQSAQDFPPCLCSNG